MTQVESTSPPPPPHPEPFHGPYAVPLPLRGRAETVPGKYLKLHAFVLIGLALMGRGFAYTMVPELVLVVGLGVMALCTTGMARLFSSLQATLLLPFMVWGAIRTVPYLGEYGIVALRDAALWGYALWAYVIGVILVSDPRRLAVTVARYRRFSAYGVWLIPALYTLQYVLRDSMPSVVGGVPLIQIQAGMTMVHVGAIGAFLILAPVPPYQLTAVLYAPAAMAMFMLANRAGQVACFVQLFLAVMIRGVSGLVLRSFLIVVSVGVLFAISGAKIHIAEREVSLEKLTTAIESVIGTSDEARYENTKEWRLNWWTDIVDYTIFGPHFWTGKGFGVNLASDDGYQLTAEAHLRSPHNSHMTVLARMGVPGAVMYVAIQLAWICGILLSAIDARRAGRLAWTRLFAFLALFWTGSMANACFDVVFEGPMGAIPFWSTVGVGMAAMWIYRHVPEVLPDTR